MLPRLGLVVHAGRMTFGMDHGGGLGWLSPGAQHGIARLWNRVACLFLGHDRTMMSLPVADASCTYCHVGLRRTRAEFELARANERIMWPDEPTRAIEHQRGL